MIKSNMGPCFRYLMVHSTNEDQRLKYPITHICFTKLTKSESDPLLMLLCPGELTCLIFEEGIGLVKKQ
jgi:hypothetical protein